MSIIALMLLQAAAPGEVAAFDLRRLKDSRAAARCEAAAGDEIVVCARPDETVRHRVEVLPPAPKELLLPKAEMRLFGDVTGTVENEAVQVANGVQSNRMMVRMKVPF